MLVNSIHDDAYGRGLELEKDYFKTGLDEKRYFSKESLASLVADFSIVHIDEEGATQKPQKALVTGLVRLIARKE